MWVKKCVKMHVILFKNWKVLLKLPYQIVLYFFTYSFLSICLASDEFSCVWHFAFSFFSFSFLLMHAFRLLDTKCTVHTLFTGPTTTLFKKYILKMGPMVLFTHLKIILLQCFNFQFSAKWPVSKQTLSWFNGTNQIYKWTSDV